MGNINSHAGPLPQEFIDHDAALQKKILNAERELGMTPVTFPGGHDGFLGGEYGQTGTPDAFAAKLREVLDS